MQNLAETVRLLLADHKGLLAMDESNGTCNKRFSAAGIPQSEDARRAYRELIITTRGLEECVSGVILYDETIRQSRADGTPFVDVLATAGIVPGIKVDTGAKDLAGHPGEKITEGLDGLRDRLQDYFKMGARFAKWRAVIGLGAGLPSPACIDANAHALARYAALCQEAGLVPIVEPEVLMGGDHTMARCAEATEAALRGVFAQLVVQGVALGAMILKPNMVLPGTASAERPTAAEVAEATVRGAAAGGSGGGSRNCLPFGRTERRTRLRTFERDQLAAGLAERGRALGAHVLLRARDPAAGPADLGGEGRQPARSPTGVAPPCDLQPRRPPRPV